MPAAAFPDDSPNICKAIPSARSHSVSISSTGSAKNTTGTPIATQDSPSPYERLGGVYSIATVVDDFVDRVTIVPRPNVNPRVTVLTP
jgi:hypothetical protein